ncbi:MAG TPA: diguanylate cyclase, partial [Paracoccus sp. (in: a-proteobacteria)]|nr:diguanylate cyclase [Paracoccus sp. (in: a-proteobacteria)]
MRLNAACHDTLSAQTGAEAMACLLRGTPDLVLIGGTPSDMGPVELCRRIAARSPGPPVMMLVDPGQQVEALRAGAAAVLNAPADELTLLARLRSLLRDNRSPSPLTESRGGGLAEEAAPFVMGGAPCAAGGIMLVTDHPATGLAWRQILAARLREPIRLRDPDRALAEAASGQVADLYIIAADIQQTGDGLRLLSELRARPLSRDAAFAVLLRPERGEMATVALDLGAGEVLPCHPAATAAEEAALRIAALIARKRLADQHRRNDEIERSLARADPLTGLANRRAVLPHLQRLCAGAGHEGGRFAVIALDIDRFKRVNDRHGHAAGDRVLTTVAARLRAAVEPPGFVARMGGEEFLAVIPGADAATAAAIARRMRHEVAATPVPLPALAGGDSLTITLSAGVATCEGHDAEMESLLERADRALRGAKASGRNCLMVARP